MLSFEVPEYDVTVPLESKDGNFANSYSMNGRFRRSLEEDDGATYHYHINALGEKLHLHVKRNTKFMAPDLMLETRDGNGQRVSRAVSRDAFVTGSVASDPDSVVALSVREGLVRLSMEGHLEGAMLQNESFFAPSKNCS